MLSGILNPNLVVNRFSGRQVDLMGKKSLHTSTLLRAKDSFTIRFGARPLEAMSDAEKQAVEQFGEGYKSFLKDSMCSPWTVKTMIEQAEKEGFVDAKKLIGKKLKPGQKVYFNNRYKSVAMAVIGKESPALTGFNFVAAHTDSPQLELKPNTLDINEGYARLKTKVRGGMTLMSWFNRPLGLAGVFNEIERGKDGAIKMDAVTKLPKVKAHFVRIDDFALSAILPPIHFERGMNEGKAIKPEDDMALLAGSEGGDGIKQAIQDAFLQKGLDLTKMAQGEIYVYPLGEPMDLGADKSMILAQGHDDRSMCYTAMQALFEAAKGKTPPQKTSIGLFVNNEEVGNEGAGGAAATWIETMVGDLLKLSGVSEADMTMTRQRILAKSFVFSADVAHSLMPNQAQYHDRNNAVKMGLGPALKADSNGRYASTAEAQAVAIALAERAQTSIQVMSTNQNVPCGSTIGPELASRFSCPVVDIGVPIASMHAANEVASKVDLYLAKKLFASFYRND